MAKKKPATSTEEIKTITQNDQGAPQTTGDGPSVAPEVVPEVAPEVVPEVAPEVTPEVAPEVVPEVAPEVVPEVAPEVVPVNPATEHNARKPFTIPVRLAPSFDGKKGLVVSGYSEVPIDGHYPHVSAHRIIRDLGLNPREWATCDERHQDIVEVATQAGLEVVTVKAYQATLEQRVEQHQ